jgi:hypothetical protein
MRSKLTLSVDRQSVLKAKELAKKRNTTVSRMFIDFIDQNSRIEQKLNALNKISGTVDADLAAEPETEYNRHRQKKHGW